MIHHHNNYFRYLFRHVWLFLVLFYPYIITNFGYKRFPIWIIWSFRLFVKVSYYYWAIEFVPRFNAKFSFRHYSKYRWLFETNGWRNINGPEQCRGASHIEAIYDDTRQNANIPVIGEGKHKFAAVVEDITLHYITTLHSIWKGLRARQHYIGEDWGFRWFSNWSNNTISK